jgi:hypothetical protein
MALCFVKTGVLLLGIPDGIPPLSIIQFVCEIKARQDFSSRVSAIIKLIS